MKNMSATLKTTPALDVREAFALRVRAAREARGWSQRDLAAAIGIGHSHVLYLERGDVSPRLETMHRVARAVGVPVAWLVFGGDDRVPERVEVGPVDPVEISRSFRARLKAARLARGLTQLALAERLGVDQGNVSAFERGVQGPKLHSLHAFADALSIPPVWLLELGEVEPWD